MEFTGNPDHLMVLKSALEKRDIKIWNSFNQKLLEGGKTADLRRADFHNLDLQAINLRGADLREAVLAGSNLQKADIQEANLEGANLEGAQMQVVNLRRANLTGTNLQGVLLQKSSLRYANLTRASIPKSNLQEADLRGADLREANFEGADLSDATMIWCKLQKTGLKNASLKGTNLEGCKLPGADLSGAILANACFQEADMRGCNLQGATLYKTDLTAVYLQNASLQQAQLRGTNLEGAYLIDTDLREAVLYKVILNQANLSGIKLYKVQYQGLALKGIICERAAWDAAGEQYENYTTEQFIQTLREKAPQSQIKEESKNQDLEVFEHNDTGPDNSLVTFFNEKILSFSMIVKKEISKLELGAENNRELLAQLTLAERAAATTEQKRESLRASFEAIRNLVEAAGGKLVATGVLVMLKDLQEILKNL